MSTPTEHLDALFALASDAQVQRCGCDNGRAVDFSAPSEPFRVGDRIAWSYPTTDCPLCEGKGAVRPPASHETYLGAITAALCFAVQMRDAELFGAMNEALDWGFAKYAESLAMMEAGGVRVQECLGNLITAAAEGRAIMQEQPVTAPAPGSGALTDDEIDELLGRADDGAPP
jgi:hypothetical protein